MDRLYVKRDYFTKLIGKKYTQIREREVNQKSSFDYNSRFLFNPFFIGQKK